MVQIPIKDLESLCLDAMTKAGLSREDAAVIADHLLENEYSGKASHGLVRVTQAIKALAEHGLPARGPELEFDNGSFARLNANRHIGVLAVKQGMDLAAERAKTYGIAVIGIRNYIATSGSMTYYLRRMCAQGLIALMGCNSVALVAPPGGRKRMLGTNPVGIGIPAGESAGDPAMIADFATSAIAYGKILVMNDKGETIPEGVLIDKDGVPSTNPDDAYDGAILPLADYRGFALGLMMELLAGPLIGAVAIKEDLYDNDGFFILAIDPQAMGNPLFYKQIHDAFDTLHACPPAPGASGVTLPGERSLETLSRTLERGWVEVADKTLASLKELT